VDDYLCLTLVARTGESEPDFRLRLTSFWTSMLRVHPDDYEKVYAEATHFGTTNGCVSRQYMVEVSAVDALCRELTAAEVDFAPVDRTDLYSKYEATPPDWFWIEH
jgi:hypothetical protein